ncbi:isoprenoid synthase domain-containing protein [Suillus clintonianus]|uniref:isoprenoid synthase domain-containing protein n=1 Tax=Suillus clintonianus TaxID=1904413 RepID=UPI001B873C1C|nr:isoprenoid synthase domain-containing protein [Suillus clintonianus]KAG2153146.1 isoprenoid synthase domain-containing protein [Suillus clintonianus]
MSSSQRVSLLNSLPSTSESQWPQANESLILEPFTYITSNPGKEIRTLLIEAFNEWLAVPNDQLKVIDHVVQMLHNASLMLDDIEDDAQLRRGQPVTHKIYGIPQTINSANYVYFLAYKELSNLRRLGGDGDEARVVGTSNLDLVVTEELLNLHRGQGLEILWRDSLKCPTEEEYISMVNSKTGGGFRIAVKLMMAHATKNLDIDFVPLVNIFGVYVQIRDDYMNLQSTEHSDNKGFAEDLTEGKFSFPIVHGVRADERNRVVMNVLQKRPTTPTLKHHTVDYLRTQTKSFDYTLEVMSSLERQIRGEIARLGGNPKIEKILDALHVGHDLGFVDEGVVP